jgi:hypothetical protein
MENPAARNFPEVRDKKFTIHCLLKVIKRFSGSNS